MPNPQVETRRNDTIGNDPVPLLVYLDGDYVVSASVAIDELGIPSTAVLRSMVLDSESTTRARAGKGRLDVPLLEAGVELSGTQEDAREEHVEFSLTRLSTYHAVFWRLRRSLLERGLLVQMQEGFPIENVRHGQLLEVQVQFDPNYGRNAIEMTKFFIELAINSFALVKTEGFPKGQEANKFKNQLKEMAQILDTIDNELGKGDPPVMLPGSMVSHEEWKVVVPVKPAHCQDRSLRILLLSSFTVVGKVARVFGAGESVSLLPELPEAISELLVPLAKEVTAHLAGGPRVAVGHKVSGPGFVLLPIGIYV
jgi:hypothetical protein